jgi:WD repeat-containing protein 76
MPRVNDGRPEMSAFERKRLENIAANKAILKDLSNAADKIIPKPVPRPNASASRGSRKKAAPVKKEVIRPTRTSSRLAGIEADSETAKRKAEEEYELAKESERAKRLRVSGDLDLSDIVVEGKRWNKGDSFFSGIVRVAQPYERTFTEIDVKETTDKELKALREKMSGLDLYEAYTPNRKYGLRCEGIVLTYDRDQDYP